MCGGQEKNYFTLKNVKLCKVEFCCVYILTYTNLYQVRTNYRPSYFMTSEQDTITLANVSLNSWAIVGVFNLMD